MNIQHITWSALSAEEKMRVARLAIDNGISRPMMRRVRRVVRQVHAHGDRALMRYTRQFDGVDYRRIGGAISVHAPARAASSISAARSAAASAPASAPASAARSAARSATASAPASAPASLSPLVATRNPASPFAVGAEEIAAADSGLSPALRRALLTAIDNARFAHNARAPRTTEPLRVIDGVQIVDRYRPIASAGLYVPRGKGSFPSMMIMQGVPATLAGVRDIVVVTPPLPDGTADPATLFVAKRLGITRIYTVGGAQAIAALAYGTASIPRVDKIFGPGSGYVNCARALLHTVVDSGFIAGPSESMIIADSNADPQCTALDLLIEAEHGNDSYAYLVTPSATCADNVIGAIMRIIPRIPEPRRSYVCNVLHRRGGIIHCADLREAADIVNMFCPEHLKIDTAHPQRVAERIDHAGEILLGRDAAFSIANYCVGANSILPTNRHARTHSGLGVADFLVRAHIISIQRNGLQQLQPHVVALADYEGFYCHAEALRARPNPDSQP